MSKTEPSIFDHVQVPLPDDCIFKISPSSISKFFEFPVIWYKEQVLGETQFHGNTASVLGSVVHALAEQYARGESSSREEVEEYLNKQRLKPDVDVDTVRSLYPDMASTLINDYVSTNKPTEVERSMCHEVIDGVYVAGTFDNRTNSIIVDYKNVSKKPSIDKIPWNYYIQLMAYAWMMKQEGTKIDKIRLVYVVRPTKTMGVRLFKVTQVIGDADYQAIEDVLNIIADTILLSKEQPQLTYLLFKSMQFKER
jgi:CRISPR/Cas system-associated exonuclease Cas4 (RecB family)